jgi:phosphoribosylformylglycinamidine cyclo-ligase
MHRVFNCGVGMVVAVAAGDAERALALLNATGQEARIIGTVVQQPAGEPATIVV